MTASLLLQRLYAVGIDDVLEVDPSAEGMAAVAGLATRRSGTQVFVKTFTAPPADDLFAQEAQGLQALRQLGHSVEQVGAAPEVFALVMTEMPDAAFVQTVSEAAAPRSYAYRCDPRPQQGRLQWTRERFTIAPQDGGTCLVSLLVEAQFDEPLPVDEYTHHVTLMAMGCNAAVEKLKLHAERGPEAVRAFERREFG